MGASGWAYFVPYQADVAAALQTLRADIFHRGDVVNEVNERLKLYRNGDYDPYTTAPRFRFDTDDLERWLSSPQPETIEDLIKILGDTGTHSVLDIDGVAETPGWRMMAPLSEEELVSLFGTTQPSRAQIETLDRWRLYATRRRWQGGYIVAYTSGEPNELFFFGYSGD